MATLTKLQEVKALIIDDEEDICYLLGNLLKQNQFDTTHVNTLHDAASFLQHESPEIIFLDNHLPDGLGINFISKIKQIQPTSKIVMITAHDTANDKDKAYSEGVDFFISKPFTRDIVNRTVQTLIH